MPYHRRKTDQQEDIEKLYDHAKIANEEMGVIKTEITWIKDSLTKVETRSWYILATIIMGFLATIAISFLK